MRLFFGFLALSCTSLTFAQLTSAEPRVQALYGEPMKYQGVILDYPDFSIRFVEREQYNSPKHPLSSTHYLFVVLSKEGGKRMGEIGFITPVAGVNEHGFLYRSEGYVAEMFYTTAGALDVPMPLAKLRKTLPNDCIVVWNETSAASRNQRLLKIWKNWRKEGRYLEQSPDGEKIASLGYYACGAAIGAPNWGNFLQTEDYSKRYPIDELDSGPVLQAGTVEYPPELLGSGFIGHVGVDAAINEDGTVRWVQTLDNNDKRFSEPVYRAVQGWRFSIPRKATKAVPAQLYFYVDVSESEPIKIVFRHEQKLNQS